MIGPSVLMVMDAERDILAALPVTASKAECLRFHDEARAVVERVALTLEASLAFIDSHVADPDITKEMAEKYAALKALNPPMVMAEFRGDA